MSQELLEDEENKHHRASHRTHGSECVQRETRSTGGKSVTVNVFARNRHSGANDKEAFDLTIMADTDSGDPITQTVFMDVNA